MNIFVLDRDPVEAAKMHCDKHMKLLLEAAQMLSIAHNETGSKGPYKGGTWKHHPCSKWVCQSIDNYRWLVKLGLALCVEYTLRYGRIHKTEQHLVWLSDNEPNLPKVPMTPFYQGMPDDVKNKDAVQAYRNYYLKYKSHFAKWVKGRSAPYWYTISLPENP